MGEYRVISLPGDGIGPEVMDAALNVLEAVSQKVPELQIQIEKREAGANHYLKTGTILPESVLNDCLKADAVLLAAIGLPEVRKPDGTEVQPDMMVGLRRAMGLHSAVRPVKLYRGVKSPLAYVSAGIDFVIIRENLEGLFASYGGGTLVGDSGWVIRAELQRPFAAPIGPLPLVVTPYLFGATGERLLLEPTVLEIRDLHASNLGGGIRFNVSETDAIPTSFYGFVEGSRQQSDDPTQDGWRLFTGVTWRY